METRYALAVRRMLVVVALALRETLLHGAASGGRGDHGGNAVAPVFAVRAGTAQQNTRLQFAVHPVAHSYDHLQTNRGVSANERDRPSCQSK